MADKQWMAVLLYAPEVAIFPTAVVAYLISLVVAWARGRLGAWLWRHRAWPRRL